MVDFKFEYHQAKEENILYTYALGNKFSSASDMITHLKEHHDHFNKVVRAMRRSLKLSEFERFLSLSNALGQEVVEHIYKEENVIFPLIEEFLPEKEKLDLLTSLQSVNNTDAYSSIIKKSEFSLNKLSKLASPNT